MAANSGANLTQVAFMGRQFVKIFVITLVTLIVGKVFLSAAVNYWVATHPAAPPPPTMGFGRLPALNFPAQTVSDKPTSYQLQTPTGKFPNFGDRAKVFLMVKSAPSLLADQRAKEIAANFGFVTEPTTLNDRTYRWTKSLPLTSTLNMDIQDYTFSMTSNYLTHPELLARNNLPDDQQASDVVKSFVSAGQQLGNDVATISGTISYLKAIGGQVSPAVSFSDADFLKVDINRSSIDSKWKAYTPDGVNAIIHAVVSGSFTGKDSVVEITNNYHSIDYSQVQTYPLRSLASAWLVMQSGQAYIAQKGTSPNAVIRSVTLGYYDDVNDQDYYQPIYVFSGDNGFIGYVPALNPLVMVQASPSPTP